MGSDLFMDYHQASPARAAIKRIIRIIKEENTIIWDTCSKEQEHKDKLINFLESEIKQWDGFYTPS